MNLRIIHVVEQHNRGDGHRTVFRDVSRLIKGELNDLQPIKIDELAEVSGSGFGAEASQAVYVLVTVAAVSLTGDVIEDKHARWELIVKS
ncbi:MAG: hypothetical protein WCG75_11625 [Armatimonadota bacterium]